MRGWLDAFAAHPRIGDVASLRAKFASTAAWCEGEQGAAVASAGDDALSELARWNGQFEAKFGHIFIVCATGKSAAEVLSLLKTRFPAPPAAELTAAAEQQAAITALRLDKLLSSLAAGAPTPAAERRTGVLESHIAPVAVAHAAAVAGGARSPVTTHVLDTSTGRPACGVPAVLEALGPSPGGGGSGGGGGGGGGGAVWAPLGRGVTDADGRIGTLLPPGAPLSPGLHRLTFDTGASGCCSFYPSVAIVFDVKHDSVGQHFHIPLLIAPFAYSTYRGS